MQEKISIIVPIYNSQETLSRCIESLCGQTYKNIEIILVNDGSKDNSLKVCESYKQKDPRIIVVDKQNRGVSIARNTGINTASGEYIMFCDSDDTVSDKWCEEMAENYVEGSLLMCEYEEGVFSSKNQETLLLSETNTEYINKCDFLNYRQAGIGSPTTKIFCKKVIEENNIRFPEELSLGEDLVFVLKYLDAVNGNIIFLHKPLYYYNTSVDNSLSKKSPSFNQCEYVFQYINLFFKKWKISDPKIKNKRDLIIMQDYEKAFLTLSRDKELSLLKKIKTAKKAVAKDSYLICCGAGVGSGNRFYNFLFKNKMYIFIVVYMLLKA